MGYQTSFHAPDGGANFLGYRKTRAGTTEVVFDDGVRRRLVWRVTTDRVDEDALSEALSRAVGARLIVPALISELDKRAMTVERVTH